ncbi:mpv17-like protein 2 [Centropristis striata]|uniref:mpv17-like protein 2 n=1 Tax=Centropristis striata TaxID=184440 RepID=UPI0027E211F4|nr:mpv17-like protein 2 [Centropristis striata]
MAPRVGRFMLNWRALFQGRTLLLTNTLSPGIMMMLGDVMQQSRENFGQRDKVHDWRRSGRIFTVGCTMGPPLTCWFYFLDRVFAGRALKTLAMKIVADQTVNSPFMGMWYFIGMGLLEGHSLSNSFKDFKGKFLELYRTDCCVWPPAQLINFYFVAPRFRVIYVNCVDCLWGVYLSYLKHRDDSLLTEPLSDSSAVVLQQEVLPPPKPLEENARRRIPAQL